MHERSQNKNKSGVDSDFIITIGPNGIPQQSFNGKTYYLYKGAKYFTKSNKRMHRVVWNYFNGQISRFKDVHHKDENSHNNRIENLELLDSKEHSSFHIKKRHKENPEWSKRFHDAGVEAAKKWHSSDAGKLWHSEQQKINAANSKQKEYECLCCGIKFSRKPFGENKFCSNNCKSQNRRIKGFDNEQRSCIECGREFTINKYTKTQSCSKSCAQFYRRKQSKVISGL